MGCDGGTIPTRDELVRLKKKPEQKDKNSELIAKWKCCSLTQEPLRKPIVACELGKLYTKESVLEFLIDKAKYEGVVGYEHIRGLKDVKELQLTDNPAFHKQKDVGDAYVDKLMAEYICPITGLEMSGRHRFCYLRSCGCVLSERALKEVKVDVCSKCNAPYKEDDVIILNGTEEDVEKLKDRMQNRRIQAKLEKKAKKKSKSAAATVTSAESSEDGPSTSKKAKLEDDAKDKTAVVNGKIGGKALANGAEGHSSKLANGKADDKLKGKSIQKDPKASSVYKSLFTTSDAGKKQQSAHWVTYNPFYN